MTAPKITATLEPADQTKPAPREYGVGRDTVVKLRVTEDERDAWDAAADRAGQSRSEWMRAALNVAAKWRNKGA